MARKTAVRRLASAICIGSALIAQQAIAKSEDQQPPIAPPPAVAGDTIVITARKKVESLQDVPVSAQVVSGATVSSQGISTIQDLTRTVPGVQLAQGSLSNRQMVRGIGSGDNPAFEQSVGTFIDDIYHGRSRSSEAGLFDIERVEVLKGPQTTYFGANAIAGALNIVTRDPGKDFSANARLLYTPALNGYQAEGGMDLPLSRTLRARFAAQASGGDGWLYDFGTGSHVPRTRNWAARGTLLWTPDDHWTVKLKGQRGESHEQGGLPLVRVGCPQTPPFIGPNGFCAAAISIGAAPYSSLSERNTSPGQFTKLTTDDYLGTVTMRQSHFSITSVTGFSKYAYDLGSDLDMTPLPLLQIQNPEKYHQFSQELRLQSDDSKPIEYLAGLYYQDSKLSPTQVFTYGFLTPTIRAKPALAALVPYLPLAIDNSYVEKAKSKSAFGALTWKPVDGLQLTGALRYSDVTKDFARTIQGATGSFTFADPVPFPASIAGLSAAFLNAAGLAVLGNTQLSRQDTHLSRSVSIQYEPSHKLMFYGRYDNGFKAGGFNGIDQTSAPSLLAFAPEYVDSFEAGAKSQFLDGRARFNFALFHSKFKDLQLSGIAPTTTGAFVNRVQNAGGAISQGVEIEAAFRISQNLNTSLNGSYLDAHYTSYPNATPTALQTLQGAKFQDLSGARTPFAPKWSANWSVNFDVPISDDLTFHAVNSLFYKSTIFLNPNNDPYVVQPGYVRDDLTLTLSDRLGWEFSIIGKNLTNHFIRTFGAALPTSLGSYVFITEPRRNISVQLSYAF